MAATKTKTETLKAKRHSFGDPLPRFINNEGRHNKKGEEYRVMLMHGEDHPDGPSKNWRIYLQTPNGRMSFHEGSEEFVHQLWGTIENGKFPEIPA